MVEIKVAGPGTTKDGKEKPGHYEYRLVGLSPQEKKGIPEGHMPHRLVLFDLDANTVAHGHVMNMGKESKQNVSIILSAGGFAPNHGILQNVTLDLPSGSMPISPQVMYNGKPLDPDNLPPELTSVPGKGGITEVATTVKNFEAKLVRPKVKIDGKEVSEVQPGTPAKPQPPMTSAPQQAGAVDEFHLSISQTKVGNAVRADVGAFNGQGKDPHAYPLTFATPAKLDARPDIGGTKLVRDSAGRLLQDPLHPLAPSSLAMLDSLSARVPVVANGNVTITAGNVNVINPAGVNGVIKIQTTAADAPAKLAELRSGHFKNGNDTNITFDPNTTSVVLVDEHGSNLVARASTGKEYKYEDGKAVEVAAGSVTTVTAPNPAITTSNAPVIGKVEDSKGKSYHFRESGGLLELVGPASDSVGFIPANTNNSSPERLVLQHNGTIFNDALKKGQASIVFPEGAKIDMNVYDKDGKKIDAAAFREVLSHFTPVGKGITVTPNESLASVAPIASDKTTTIATGAVDPKIQEIRKLVADFKTLVARDAPTFIEGHSKEPTGIGQSFTALDNRSSRKDRWTAEDISKAGKHVANIQHAVEVMLARTGNNNPQSPESMAFLRDLSSSGILRRLEDAVKAVQPSKDNSQNVEKKEEKRLVADKSKNDLGQDHISTLDGKPHVAAALAVATKGLPQPENKELPGILRSDGGAGRSNVVKTPESQPMGKEGGASLFT